MSKIQSWEEQIAKFKNLSLKNAKALYREYLEDGDADKRNLLIESTLYISSKSAKELAKTLEEDYNIEDIIHLSDGYYIDEVAKGRLLEIKNFSEIFDDKYKEFIKETLKLKKKIIIEEPVKKEVVKPTPQPGKKIVVKRKLKVKMVVITVVTAIICLSLLVLGVYLTTVIN